MNLYEVCFNVEEYYHFTSLVGPEMSHDEFYTLCHQLAKKVIDAFIDDEAVVDTILPNEVYDAVVDELISKHGFQEARYQGVWQLDPEILKELL